MSKRVLPLTLLFILIACAKATGPSGASGIQGEVTIGPTCPVEMAGSPCPDAPFAATITVSQDGEVATTFTTGDDGRFHIPLDPGTYELTAVPVQPGGIASLKPLPAVTVSESTYTGVTISFDSGIR